MAFPIRYFDLVREMRDAYNHRLRLVQYARREGIKPAARAFATTVPTVRKWLRRFQQQGPSGLQEQSRKPHHCPHQTPPAIEEQVLALRRQLPTFGAARLKREFDLRPSHVAIQRIWRQHGLIRKRRKKYQRKQDLAAVKATWRLFQQISADTKDLDDIPYYWFQAQRLGLPGIQYTAREVRSGLLFWAFAQRRTAAASVVFAARVQRHLDRYGIALRDLVWQTDNGGEFIGSHDPQGRPTGFPAALGDSQHVRIPPAAHTYQSDVETVHRLEEDEFFDLETFASRAEFLAKVTTYQLYFNLVRPNSHKENQSPWQIIERLAPRSPLELCLLPPVFLDYYIERRGGKDLPSLPYEFFREYAGDFGGRTGNLRLFVEPAAQQGAGVNLKPAPYQGNHEKAVGKDVIRPHAGQRPYVGEKPHRRACYQSRARARSEARPDRRVEPRHCNTHPQPHADVQRSHSRVEGQVQPLDHRLHFLGEEKMRQADAAHVA